MAPESGTHLISVLSVRLPRWRQDVILCRARASTTSSWNLVWRPSPPFSCSSILEIGVAGNKERPHRSQPPNPLPPPPRRCEAIEIYVKPTKSSLKYIKQMKEEANTLHTSGANNQHIVKSCYSRGYLLFGLPQTTPSLCGNHTILNYVCIH